MIMELSKNYIPSATEDKWYEHWMHRRYFSSRPDERPAFTVVIPPPNVTGVLHMGHTLNETVQDILVRKARMNGFNACWVPGSDHASIATEAKVVGMLKERGIDKNQLTRAEFMNHRSRQAFSPMLRMCRNAQNLEFVRERPPPHEVRHRLPVDFRHFKRIVAELPRSSLPVEVS